MSECENLEQIFKDINGDKLLITTQYLATLMDRSKDIECPEKAKENFFKSRLLIRIKDLNAAMPVLGKRKIIKITT